MSGYTGSIYVPNESERNFADFNKSHYCKVCGKQVNSFYGDNKTGMIWCPACWETSPEWQAIKDRENSKAFPAKIFLGVSLLFLAIVILRVVTWVFFRA